MGPASETATAPAKVGWLTLLAIFLVALCLRQWPAEHGMPRRYVPDDHVVRNALGMARDKDPLPPMGTYSTYPYLVPYLLLPVYGAQYALGRAAGDWEDADEFGQRLLDEPGLAQVPARRLIGLFGALTALLVIAAGRSLGLGGGAAVAGWLTATSLLSVQLSTHARPWIPLVCFSSFALWRALEFTKRGRTRDLLASGLGAGLAYASHQAGLTALAIPACAWLFAPIVWRAPAAEPGRERPRSEVPRHFARGFACVLAFAAVALLLGYGYYLKHGATAAGAVVGADMDVAGKISIGGQSTVLGVSLESAATLSKKLFGYDPVLVVLGLIGAALALSRRAYRAPLLAFVLIGGFFLTNPSDHIRYMLPATPFLALFGGLAAERLGRGHLGRAGLALLLAFPLVQALRMDWLLTREDTRAEAERALEALPPEAFVAIDHYGPTPEPSLAALQRLFELRTLYSRELSRANRLQTGELDPRDGLNVIRVEELFETRPDGHYGVRRALLPRGSQPEQVLASLGVTHLLLVDRRPTRDAPWLGYVADTGETLAVFDPSRPGPSGDQGPAPAREAFLPTEMDFPLTGLWQVSRPGPWMRLVELPETQPPR